MVSVFPPATTASNIYQLLAQQSRIDSCVNAIPEILSATEAMKVLRLTEPTAPPPPSYHSESIAGSEDYNNLCHGSSHVKFTDEGKDQANLPVTAKRKRIPRSPQTYKCAEEGTTVIMKENLVSEG
jgi:hypothetical protein